MNRKQRQHKKKVERELRLRLKLLRKGAYVTVVVHYGELHTALLYVFSPNMPRQQIRDGFDFCVRTLMKIDGYVIYSVSSEYPHDYMIDPSKWSKEYPPVQLTFIPHKVLATFYEVLGDRRCGVSIGKLWRKAKEQAISEHAFRASLNQLTTDSVLTVLANGFVWRKEDAVETLGITLQKAVL